MGDETLHQLTCAPAATAAPGRHCRGRKACRRIKAQSEVASGARRRGACCKGEQV